MEEDSIDIFAHPKFLNLLGAFQQKYNLQNILCQGDPLYSKRSLKRYSQRTCRFCRLSYPETKFSSLSHLLPQAIGNSNLYSDFECDSCNAKFSGFENDLSEYLGISRSITGLNDEKKTRGFAGRRIGAKSRSFMGNNILIIAPEDAARDGNNTVVTYTKNSFIPSGVYKALLKFALSILSDAEVKTNYQHALDYLSGKFDLSNGAFISGYQLSFQTTLPLHVYVFQKKNKETNVPTHVFCFHFQNHIISLPLPWHKEDSLFEQGLSVIIPPPFFTNKDNMAIVMPLPFVRDLSSTTEVKDEEETITFELNLQPLENTWCYDSVIDKFEKKEYNPSYAKFIILTKEGATFDPKELATFIEEQMEVNT